MLPEILVNATDLDNWAERLDARSTLPRVIRRLVSAAPIQIEQIEFRSDEGTQLGGWDGVLKATTGNQFIPAGQSAWEFGTNQGVKAKADYEYDNRKDDLGGLDPTKTTFVFVTLRRWGGKNKWIRTRKAEGFWSDVKAYDADDLAAWLECAPGVHLWLSILTGKRPEGAIDIANFWDDWADVTEPRISADLVLSRREDEIDRLFSWLQGDPSSLALQSDSRDEAIAFFAAALERLSLEERERYLVRGIVVEDIVSWRHLTASKQPLILIPKFDDRDVVTRAVKQGHHVLIPIGKDEPTSSATVTIPRLKRERAKQALVAMGLPDEKADDLATLARRSLMALRRKLAISPEVQRPDWAKPVEARTLLPALMVGGWNDTLAGDREILAKLARKPYEDLNDRLSRAASEPDPPIRRVGDVWLIASKEDSWALTGRYISREDLENFESVVFDVFGQPDPAFDLPVDQRYMANILGKSLPYSGLLREGLAESLALLGSWSDSLIFADATTGQERANRIVGKLLQKANANWKVWASIAAYLPLLGEAAPTVFLDEVERGLLGESPVLLNMFSEGRNTLFGSSPHTGLLWALETVARNPEYLGHAASLLAKLARLDPGGKLANRPAKSLHDIFQFWHPQTMAGLDKRLSVLDSIREHAPHVAWSLLNTLLPERLGGVAFRTAKPKWREWTTETLPQVTYAELEQAEREIVSRLLAEVGTDGQRWKDLISKVDDVSKEQHDTIVEKLLTLEVGSFTDEDKMTIWYALQDVISRHREFADAEWAMPAPMVDRLRRAYDRFAPDDLISQQAWLFSITPKLLNPPEGDWHARQDAVQTARLDAVRELKAKGGLSLVVDFAAGVERPGEVGFTVGQSDLVDAEENDLLSRYLGSTTASENLFARGLVAGRFRSRGWDWVDCKLAIASNWLPEQRADFLASLSFEPRTWALLDAETERLYWSRVLPFGLPNRDHSEYAALKLIEYGRPHAAIDFIALYTDEKGPAVPLPVIAQALESLLEKLQEGPIDLSSIGYDITRLLRRIAASDEIDESRVAALEWAYLPIIKNYGSPKVLHRELSRNPAFFAEVVSLVYKGKDEESREMTAEKTARARLGYELLHSWRQCPGLQEDGSLDSKEFSEWVHQARLLLKERDRQSIGDQTIGGAIVYAPLDSDGSWPHAAVRNVIEKLESDHLETGIEFGVYNSRGVFMKSQTEGGAQEREIAERYQGYANQLSDRWPRTAAMLRRIARVYVSDAHREDISAELTEDLWR
ncbi:MAG TPA: hypothetical protein VJ875_16285 [Pyrinomonadaceae bacterium]|nr:hypothetical protein [Pyrinomonadaceae bacterium]